jgi:hypothetical protein
MDKNNYNSGNTRNGIEDTAKINIEREVSELIKKGADRASMNDLRKKFGDDKIFDMVQESYFDRLASIRKRSIKFTKLIERKYGMFGHPLHIILNKALKYKKKYNLSEEEFELFRQYYQKTMNMRNNANKYDVLVPNTNMAKVFGEDPYNNNKIHVSDGDHRIVKDILTLYELNRALWQQVTLQSITYDDSDPIGTSRLVDTKTSNFSSFIHPVIAAMFLPKIARFDEYFLFTNLAYILRCKYLGEPVSTYHSYLMLYNLVTDPTDVVCNADSPLKDILNRVALQVTLWKNVLRLRHGMVYDSYNSFAAADLMVHIDNCKLSTYDAPDLMMIGDENVIIRRLLSALAFRCATIFSTPTTYPLFIQNQNQINMQVSALNIPANFTQVTKVPMIYIRLPVLGMPAVQPTGTSILDIQSALNTTQPMMYNGRLESRAMSVAGADGVLIVSIPRRTYRPMSGNIYNLPQIFNFATMPHHAYGLETLNNTKVFTNSALEIKTYGKEDVQLLNNHLFIKSVVTLKETQGGNNNNFIYGSKTFILNTVNQSNTLADGTSRPVPVTGRLTPVQGYGIVYVYDPITKLTSAQNAVTAAAAVLGAPAAAAVAGAAVAAPIMSAVRNVGEEDKVRDFTINQTILIYTNELSKSSSSNQDLIRERYKKLIEYKTKNNNEYNPYFPGLFSTVQQAAWSGATGALREAAAVEKGFEILNTDFGLLQDNEVTLL